MNTNLVRVKNALIEEAKLLNLEHPSKDCRAFAGAILKFFEMERQDTLSQLSGSVVEKQLKGRIIRGCIIR